MTQNLRFGLLAIALLVVLALFNQMHLMDNHNKSLQEDLPSLEKQAVSFFQLKKRWGKKGTSKKLLAKLSQVKAFDRRFKKAANIVLEYDALDSKTLDRISYLLFTSDVLLVNVSIHKDDGFSFMSIEMKL